MIDNDISTLSDADAVTPSYNTRSSVNTKMLLISWHFQPRPLNAVWMTAASVIGGLVKFLSLFLFWWFSFVDQKLTTIITLSAAGDARDLSLPPLRLQR